MFGHSASPEAPLPADLELRTFCCCRNAYNDLYHWTARYSFLEKLISEGREHYNVVYIDPDILIMQDLHSVFEREFDYLMTISENEEQPINGAMHFVPKGKYHEVRPPATDAVSSAQSQRGGKTCYSVSPITGRGLTCCVTRCYPSVAGC